MALLPGVARVLLLYAYLLASLWPTPSAAAGARLLIFSATQNFRHDSIPTAIGVLKAKGSSINVEFDATEDASWFSDEKLAQYDGLVFLSTTGNVLQTDTTFQKYLNLGGNFVGIHSACDTLRTSTAYIHELDHSTLQNFTVDILEPTHPSVSKLPKAWNVRDEPYNFEIDPQSLGAKVVLAADETSYVDTGAHKFDQGSPHPIAWYQERGAGVQPGGIAGRSFYTSLGHLNETWHDDLFLAHVLGGISWVLQSNTTRAFNSSASVGNPQGNAQSSSSPSSPSSSSSPSKPSSGSRTNIVTPWVVVGGIVLQYIICT